MCQGSIFKAEKSLFRTERGFGLTIRLRKIKKLSCPGCSACEWEDDAFGEICNDWPILNIEEATSGKFYKLVICNEVYERGWGAPISWDLKLMEIKNG